MAELFDIQGFKNGITEGDSIVWKLCNRQLLGHRQVASHLSFTGCWYDGILYYNNKANWRWREPTCLFFYINSDLEL